MENPEKEKAIKKNALSSGLVLGAVSCVMGIFAFYFITSMTSSIFMMLLVPGILAIVAPIVIAVFMTLDMRKKIGGFWSFKQATTAVFIMFFISYVASAIVTNGIFATVVEPKMTEKIQNSMMEGTVAMLEKTGADQSKIDKQVDEVEKKFKEQQSTTIGKKIQGVATTIILLFVVSLIFGGIFKKEQPLFDVVDPE